MQVKSEKTREIGGGVAAADGRASDASSIAATVDTVPATPARGRGPSASSILARIESATAAKSTLRRRRGSSNRGGQAYESVQDDPSGASTTAASVQSAPVSPRANGVLESRGDPGAGDGQVLRVDVPAQVTRGPSLPDQIPARSSDEALRVAPGSDEGPAAPHPSDRTSALHASRGVEQLADLSLAAPATGTVLESSQDSISLRISSFMSRLGPLGVGTTEQPPSAHASAVTDAGPGPNPGPSHSEFVTTVPQAHGGSPGPSPAASAFIQGPGAAVTYDEF